MGMKPNESKEMLFLNEEGAPCIDYALKQCAKNNLEPLIITREEKTDLIDYCVNLNIDCISIASKGEWVSTILSVCDFWDESNVLLLPDTRWTNEKALATIVKSKQDLCLGLHLVEDPENWGILSGDYVIEKPKNLKGPHLAWGVIKFSKERGYDFFSELSSNDGLAKAAPCEIVNLGSFKDITRTRL